MREDKFSGPGVRKTDRAVQPPLPTASLILHTQVSMHGTHFFSVMSGMTVGVMKRPRKPVTMITLDNRGNIMWWLLITQSALVSQYSIIPVPHAHSISICSQGSPHKPVRLFFGLHSREAQ